MQKDKKSRAAALMLLCLFVLLAVLVQFEFFRAFDRGIVSWVEQNRTEGMTALMKAATECGGTVGLIVGVIILALFPATRRSMAIPVAALLIVSAGINLMLKMLFSRPRPDGVHLVSEGGYSFPSGHAMNSMVFYGAVALILWMMLREKGVAKGLCRAVCALFAVMVLLIGASRVYLGVHYPADILAGFAAGGALLGLFYPALQKWRWEQSGPAEEP